MPFHFRCRLILTKFASEEHRKSYLGYSVTVTVEEQQLFEKKNWKQRFIHINTQENVKMVENLSEIMTKKGSDYYQNDEPDVSLSIIYIM